jgi:hypothetical protein
VIWREVAEIWREDNLVIQRFVIDSIHKIYSLLTEAVPSLTRIPSLAWKPATHHVQMVAVKSLHKMWIFLVLYESVWQARTATQVASEEQERRRTNKRTRTRSQSIRN